MKPKTWKDYRLQCILAPAFKFLEVCFELLVPLVVAAIIDRGIAQQDRPFVWKGVGIMAALAIIGFLCTVVAQYFAAKAAVGIAGGLRSRLFAHIQGLSYESLDRFGTSALMSRLTQDVNQVQTGWNLSLRLLLRSPCVVFGAMIMAFTIDRQISLLFLGMIAALSVVVFGIMLSSIPRYQKVQGRLDSVLDSVRQNLTGVRVMRAFCREDEETEEFSTRTDLLMKMQNRVGRLSAFMNPLTYLLVNGTLILLLQLGALRIESATLTQGQVVALYNYLTQILIELIKLADLIITITKAVACHRRIGTVLQTTSTQTQKEMDPTAKGDPAYAVEFQDVTFRYASSEVPALSHVSFALRPGQTLGIVGGTGSGKSTLVQLIPRFYDATEGKVLVGGQDVCTQDSTHLRSCVGMVPQKAVLFSGTVAENLRFGAPHADTDTLWSALQTAQAAEFVSQKEGGLEAPVTPGGKNFSGGQRQRLTIARALAIRPNVLILDDSSSALDYATDAKLRQALAELPEQPAKIIVSQRTAAIAGADEILVLDDGHVVGQGTHAELLESCPVYREIHISQTGKEAQA